MGPSGGSGAGPPTVTVARVPRQSGHPARRWLSIAVDARPASRLWIEPFERSFIGHRPATIPARSTLAANSKARRPETLETVHRIVLGAAREAGIEDGRRVRVGCTVVESNVHQPTDSPLSPWPLVASGAIRSRA